MNADVVYSSVNFSKKKQQQSESESQKTTDPLEDVINTDIQTAKALTLQEADGSNEDEKRSQKHNEECNPCSSENDEECNPCSSENDEECNPCSSESDLEIELTMKTLAASLVPPKNGDKKACQFKVLLIFCILQMASLVGLTVFCLQKKGNVTKAKENQLFFKTDTELKQESINGNNTVLAEEYERVKKMLTALETRYGELNKNHVSLQSHCGALNKNHTNLTAQYEVLNKSHDSLESQYGELNKNHGKLKFHYGQLNKNHEYLQFQYEELTKDHASLQMKYGELSKNHARLQYEYAVLNKRATALEKYHPPKGTSWSQTCSVCPQNWLLFISKCYFLSTDKLGWSDSQDHCFSERGHLVIIENKEEQDFLTVMVEIKGGKEKSYWIGLSDRVTEGDFVWVNDRPLDPRKRFWGKRESDNGQELDNWTDKVHSPTGEDCVELKKSKSYNGWYDANCRIQKKRICETAALTYPVRFKS